MEHWWNLTDAQRGYFEHVVSHIVHVYYQGNRAAVLSMLTEAHDRNVQRSPLCAALLWRLREEVDES